MERGLYMRIGGIGGSSILELSKYPLRFEVSLVLLSPSASVFSPSLARYRFLYLICEHVCIACSTVACALTPLYQLKRMSIIIAFRTIGPSVIELGWRDWRSHRLVATSPSAPLLELAHTVYTMKEVPVCMAWLSDRMVTGRYAGKPTGSRSWGFPSILNARRIYLPSVSLFLIKPESIPCPALDFPYVLPTRPPDLSLVTYSPPPSCP